MGLATQTSGSDCEALINDGDFSVVVVPAGGFTPGSTGQTCGSTSLASGWTLAVMDGTDNSGDACWSNEETTSDNIVITADVYVVDGSNNRPFNRVEVKCTMPTAVTVNPYSYSVAESAVTGPETTAAATTLDVEVSLNSFLYAFLLLSIFKAWANGQRASGAIFGVGQEVYFFVEPPAVHSALIFTPGTCTADGTTIDSTYDYHLADSDCGITNAGLQIGDGTYGVCMHVYAKSDGGQTTIACTASLALV